jgi:hypothetical protein
VEERYKGKIEELRRTFELAGYNAQEAKKRKVPDWCLDDITFSVMLDPVVVCLLFLFSQFENALEAYLQIYRRRQASPTTAPRSWNISSARPPTP